MRDLHSSVAETLPAPAQRRLPTWATAVAAVGIAWNLYGLVQYQSALTAIAESLVASGLTPD
jgi:hypothetical protein